MNFPKVKNYLDAKPFPHVVLKDLFPESLLQRVVDEFPDMEKKHDRQWINPRENKRMLTSELSESAKDLVQIANSHKFCNWLETFTGIKNVIPDNSLVGGGYHELPIGGYLGMHTDFNYHVQMGLYRRINLLVYLNKDWRQEDGGNLLLGKDKGTVVVPEFGTCVVFNTTSESWHGNPEPVKGRPRRSFAFYYYAEEPADVDTIKDTVFI